jgi:hypothetical protein
MNYADSIATMSLYSQFISWPLEADVEDPDANQIAVAKVQEEVKTGHGVLSGATTSNAGRVPIAA